MREFMKQDKLKPYFIAILVVMFIVEVATNRIIPIFHVISYLLMAFYTYRYIKYANIQWKDRKIEYIVLASFLIFAVQYLIKCFQ